MGNCLEFKKKTEAQEVTQENPSLGVVPAAVAETTAATQQEYKSLLDIPTEIMDQIPLFTFNGLEFDCFVYDVYDGDTCTLVYQFPPTSKITPDSLQKRRIRLFGIDSPELRTRDKEEKKAGYISKDFLVNLIKGKIVRVKFMKEEKFGRLMGNIYLPGEEKSVNEYMVENGMAKPYFGGKKEKFSEAKEAEEDP